MTNEQFEQHYLPKYESVIKALARKLARKDQELYEDLRQVGMISLWQLDPTNAVSNEDAWIRQALYNKMTDVLRRERPAKYESLSAHLARGDQVVEDEILGGARLLHASSRPRSEASDFVEEDDDR